MLQHARCIIARRAGPRLFSTTTSGRLSSHHSIYVSNSTNPYFNLSLEDWLFRHKHHKDPLLLLYRDSPCVVIGRNQNPWKEVNLDASRRRNIPFIRRRSGGGTVYHDLGNTNFSIHLSRTTFDRHHTAQVVLRAVRALGIDASVNDRNDICIGKDKICGRKCFSLSSRKLTWSSVRYVSGSAYKIVNNRAYHHGTMLISTELNTLGDLLRTNKFTMDTKGVASVRSPVCNLQQYDASVSHENFVRAVVNAFREEYGIDEDVQQVAETEDIRDIEYIRDGMSELSRWDWAFGQTPEFTYTIQRAFSWGEVTAKIRSKHGLILACSLHCSTTDGEVEDFLSQLGSSLKDQKYGFVNEGDLERSGLRIAEHGAQRDIWRWLHTEMIG